MFTSRLETDGFPPFWQPKRGETPRPRRKHWDSLLLPQNYFPIFIFILPLLCFFHCPGQKDLGFPLFSHYPGHKDLIFCGPIFPAESGRSIRQENLELQDQILKTGRGPSASGEDVCQPHLRRIPLRLLSLRVSFFLLLFFVCFVFFFVFFFPVGVGVEGRNGPVASFFVGARVANPQLTGLKMVFHPGKSGGCSP